MLSTVLGSALSASMGGSLYRSQQVEGSENQSQVSRRRRGSEGSGDLRYLGEFLFVSRVHPPQDLWAGVRYWYHDAREIEMAQEVVRHSLAVWAPRKMPCASNGEWEWLSQIWMVLDPASEHPMTRQRVIEHRRRMGQKAPVL